MTLPLNLTFGESARYGIIVALFPSDLNLDFEIEVAPDSAGSPDTANSGFQQVPAGSEVFIHETPNDGLTRHYRVRHVGPGFEPSDWTCWKSDVPKKLPPIAPAPVAKAIEWDAQPTEPTTNVGKLTLTVTDPQCRLSTVEFSTKSGKAAATSFAAASLVSETGDEKVYEQTVNLVEKHNSLISYRVTYYDEAGTLRTGGDTLTFDTGNKPNILQFKAVMNDLGEVSVIVNGDSDTASWRIATSTVGEPSEATIDAATSYDGRSFETAVLITPAEGQTLYVGAKAYSAVSGAGTASEIVRDKVTRGEAVVAADGDVEIRSYAWDNPTGGSDTDRVLDIVLDYSASVASIEISFLDDQDPSPEPTISGLYTIDVAAGPATIVHRIQVNGGGAEQVWSDYFNRPDVRIAVEAFDGLAGAGNSIGTDAEIALQSGGTLPVIDGGTGNVSLSTGSLLLGSGTSPVATLAGSASTHVPVWNGSAFAARQVDFTDLSGTVSNAQVPQAAVTQHQAALSIAASQVTGTLGTANGGTGLSTFTAGGRLLYSTDASALITLAIGANGTFLRSDGISPSWATISTVPTPAGAGYTLQSTASASQWVLTSSNYVTNVSTPAGAGITWDAATGAVTATVAWADGYGTLDGRYSQLGHTHADATISVSGFLSGADKTKLNTWTGATTFHQFNTTSGWIRIGPQNTSFCHVYTDAPEFYFNKEIKILGVNVSKTDHTHALTSTSITGTLPTSKGGTGLSTFTAGGRLLYSADASSLVTLAIGANGTFLRSDGISPSWATISTVPTPAGAGYTLQSTASASQWVLTSSNYVTNLSSPGGGGITFAAATGAVTATVAWADGYSTYDARYSLTSHTHAANALTGTTLASNVVSSSLTGVGTLTVLTVTGNVTSNGYVLAGLDRFGATTTSGTLDWNSHTRPGAGVTLMQGNVTNGPSGNTNYYHAFNFEYGGTRDGTGQITQFAIPYALAPHAGIYVRGRYTGTWTAWERLPSLSMANTWAAAQTFSSTLTIARSNMTLTGHTTAGVVYTEAGGALMQTAAGASGQFLRSNGLTGPSWVDISTVPTPAGTGYTLRSTATSSQWVLTNSNYVVSVTTPAGGGVVTDAATGAISLTVAWADGYGTYDARYPLQGGTGASGTWGIAITGNAGTATALQTARTINGVSFNGTANITVAAAAGTLTGTALASGVVTSSLTSVGTLTSLSVSGASTLTGNVTIGSAASVSFGSTTRQMLNLYSTSYGIGVQSSTQYFRSAAQWAWHEGGVHSDTSLDPGTGGTLRMKLVTGILTVPLQVHVGTNLLVNTTSNPSSYAAVVNGTLQATDILKTSARHLKMDIVDLPLALARENVMALRARTYQWRASGKRDWGFIADEVSSYFGTPAQDAVSFDRMTAALVPVVQDHEWRIAELERENARLRSMLEAH